MCPSEGIFVVGPIDPATNRGLIFGRELLGHFLRQLRAFQVDLAHPVAEIKLFQDDAGALESVGLDDVAAHAEKVRMNVANNVRTAQHQHFVAVLPAPVIVQGWVPLVNVGPHRAVVDDDAFLHGL